MCQNVNSEAQKQVLDILFQRNENQTAMNRSGNSIISDTDIDDSYILSELSKLPEPSELWDNEGPQESNYACAQPYVTRDVSDAAKQGVSWKQQYNDDIRNEGKLMQYKKIDGSHGESQQLLNNIKQPPVHDAEYSKMQGTSFSHNSHTSYPASYPSTLDTSGFHKTGDIIWGQKFQQPVEHDNRIEKPFQKVYIESESRHLSALAKKHEVCRNNARLLKSQLNQLKVQRNELRGNGVCSPETMNYLKENTKMQLEIKKKLKAVDEVVKMLNGISAEEPTETRSTKLTAQPRAPNQKQCQYNYVHYDPEMYWCHLCDEFPQTAKDYLDHLHTPKHQTNAAGHSETPWNIFSGFDEGFPTLPSAPAKRTPIKGLQFFVPSIAWFCKLCKHFMGDLQCASTHLRSVVHTRNYNTFIEHNPHWETDWISDRQKAFEKCRSNKLEDMDLSTSPTKKKKKRKHTSHAAPPSPPSEHAICISSSSPSSDSDGEPCGKKGKGDKGRLNVDTSDPNNADYVDQRDGKTDENLQIKIKLDKLAELERQGSESSSRDVSVVRDASRDRSRDRLRSQRDRTVPRDRPDDRRDRRRRYDARRGDRDRRYDSRPDDRDGRYGDRRDDRDRRYDDRHVSRHDGRRDDWRSRHDDRFDRRRSPSRGQSVDNRDVKREKLETSKSDTSKIDLNKMVLIGKMPSIQHAASEQKKAQKKKEENNKKQENKKQDGIQMNVEKWKDKVEEQTVQEKTNDEREIQELAAALLANPYLFPPPPAPAPAPLSDVTPNMNSQELYPGWNVGFPYAPGMMAPGMAHMMNPGGMPGMMPQFPGQGLLGPAPIMSFGMNQTFVPPLHMPMYNQPRGSNKQRRNQNNCNDQKNNKKNKQKKTDSQQNNNNNKKQDNDNTKDEQNEPESNQDINKKHHSSKVENYQNEIENDQNQDCQKVYENEEKIDKNHEITNINMQDQNENEQLNDLASEQKTFNSLNEEKPNPSSQSADEDNQKTINEPNEQLDGNDDEKNNVEDLKEKQIVLEPNEQLDGNDEEKNNVEDLKEEQIVLENQNNEAGSISIQSDENVVNKFEHGED